MAVDRDRAVLVAEQDGHAHLGGVGADEDPRGVDEAGAEAQPPRGVVVAAGQDDLGPGPGQPHQRLVGEPDGVDVGQGTVVDVAGDHHEVDPLGLHDVEQVVDVRRLVREHPLAVERPAQVPVGGVEDAHRETVGGAADSPSHPRRGTVTGWAWQAGGMDPIVVVGAGISGVACARRLAAAGLPVQVVDRGRRLGGRMASRRLEGRPVDLGASYLTVSDDRFGAVVEAWEAAGLARRWTDSFAVIEDGRVTEVKAGPLRWGTPGGIRSLVEDLAGGLDVRTGEVELVGPSASGRVLVDGRPCSAVVLAMPDAQARRAARSRPRGGGRGRCRPTSSRCWPSRPASRSAAGRGCRRPCRARRSRGRSSTATSTWPGSPTTAAGGATTRRCWSPTRPRRTPRRTSPIPSAAAQPLVAALRRVLGIAAEPTTTHLQRWSLARPVTTRTEPFLLSESLVGACGDGWATPAKVEGAYLSGLALGEELVARLG